MLRISAPGAREAIGELVALVAWMAHEIEVLSVRANQHAGEISKLRTSKHNGLLMNRDDEGEIRGG